MRYLLHIEMPHEPFNTFARSHFLPRRLATPARA